MRVGPLRRCIKKGAFNTSSFRAPVIIGANPRRAMPNGAAWTSAEGRMPPQSAIYRSRAQQEVAACLARTHGVMPGSGELEMPLLSSLRNTGLAGLGVAALAGQPAGAQAPAGSPPSPARLAQEQLLLRLPAGQPLDRYLEQLRSEFFNLDADSDGKLTPRDVELHALMETAQARSVAWMSVLRYDLDGDGFVTEDEVRRSAAYESRWSRAQSMIGKSPLGSGEEAVQRAVTTIMALDTNKDGKVSLAEAAKFNEASQRQASALNGFAAKTRLALALEAATSGELSRAGYEAAGETLFRAVDTDHDGNVSQQELMEFRRAPMPPSIDPEAAQRRQFEQAELARKRQIAIDAERAACGMPPVSEKAKVVLLGAYQTESLSSVTIGQQDTEVYAGRINVEPGKDPLYLVIASFSPTIWQFGGAVERIERVVVTSSSNGRSGSDPKQGPVAGVTGIARDRVSFLGRSNCMRYFDETPSSGSLLAVGAVKAAVGGLQMSSRPSTRSPPSTFPRERSTWSEGDRGAVS
ncbi:hypothetical protein CK489_18045 [Bradyrhizobium sp. UFLA03-84]|nr:hypothetical protein CK489_18045 [Bradyrhizobium sp. UFLA03-84]